MDTITIYLLLLLLGAVVGGAIILAIVRSLTAAFSAQMPMRYSRAMVEPVPQRGGIGSALLAAVVGGLLLVYWSSNSDPTPEQEKTQLQMSSGWASTPVVPKDTLPEKTLETVEHALPQPAPAIKTLPAYYLQVGAFQDEQNAEEQLKQWSQQFAHDIHLGFQQDEAALYKIVIGPFENTARATAFAKRHTIQGFVRTDEALELVTYR